MKNFAIVLITALAFASCRDTADRAGTFNETELTEAERIDQLNKQVVELEKQRLIDSMKTATATQEREAAERRAAQRPVVVNNSTPAATSATQTEAERKKMSGAAKGALIGAGAGAITGAVVDKKKPGRGAVIGGLAGAGVGAGTGAIIDGKKKKDGK